MRAPPISITVSWDGSTGKPTAPDTNVSISQGRTVLQWKGDDTIGSITGITGLPSSEFTLPQSSSAKVWTSTDKCTKKGVWEYKIAGTNAAGTVGNSDPQIHNV